LARKIGQQLACACGGFIIHSLFEMDLEFECQADGKSQENIRRYTSKKLTAAASHENFSRTF
jgi:hypothetical protein